jgi:hypothetical protein
MIGSMSMICDAKRCLMRDWYLYSASQKEREEDVNIFLQARLAGLVVSSHSLPEISCKAGIRKLLLSTHSLSFMHPSVKLTEPPKQRGEDIENYIKLVVNKNRN